MWTGSKQVARQGRPLSAGGASPEGLSPGNAVLSTLARAAGGGASRLSGHLVQAPGAGAHLSQPTSGEGGPQAPPLPPTPKPSPRAPTLVYLGGSIPGRAPGVEWPGEPPRTGSVVPGEPRA